MANPYMRENKLKRYLHFWEKSQQFLKMLMSLWVLNALKKSGYHVLVDIKRITCPSGTVSDAWKIIDFPKPVGKINENVIFSFWLTLQLPISNAIQATKIEICQDTVIWSIKRSKVIGPSSYVQRRLASPGLEIISQLVLVTLFIQTYFCSDATRFWADKYL